MNKIAQIIPAVRLKRNLNYFDYSIPDELKDQIKIGQIVQIPFRNKIIKGVVFNLIDQMPKSFNLKQIHSLENLSLLPWQLELIKFIATSYFVSMATALKMVLPEIPKRSSAKKRIFKIEFHDLPKQKFKLNSLKENNKVTLLRYFQENQKMQAYLQLIKSTLKANKQVVIIVPQLSDLPKIIQYLEKDQESISILLNDLPKNQYWQEWQKISKGQAKIIIGTRSAIFAPFNKLGLIIIDEEDDSNHKQEEPNPRYQVKEIALKLKELLKVKVILSAMTPSLEALNKVVNKEWAYWELGQNNNAPQVKIINNQEEFKKANYSIFSEQLILSINEQLEKKQKSFLFLNRKGLATSLTCKDCGYSATCPTCKLPLTYHLNKELLCHHCGYKQDMILVCPQCHSTNLKLSGIGTEKVKQEITKKFPQANIIKIDQETPLLDQLDKYEIIIGTQFAFNYIDWSQVGLIGVINADTLLYLPDYRALEKTFSILVKLYLFLNDTNKQLIIQTSFSENYIFSALKNLDYKKFYQQEIKARKNLHYPPFCQLIKLIYQSVEFNFGQQEIEHLYQSLISKLQADKSLIITPPLAYYTQQKYGRWRWQIIIKNLDPQHNLQFLQELPENIIIDINPESIL